MTSAVAMIIMSWISMAMGIMTSTVASSSSYLMEFYTVVAIILSPIKTDVRKIIPNRKYCCGHHIREEELIEHEDDCERNNRILVAHDKTIEG